MKKEDDFIQNCPTLEESISAIKNLEGYNWPEFDLTEFKSINDFKTTVLSKINDEFNYSTQLIQSQKCSEFNLNLFRVRELSTIKNLEIFSEHSFPPPYFTKMGRCNFPENPVFYCSNDPGTSLFEVIRDSDYKKTQFCISRWKVKKSDELLIFENYLRKELPDRNPFKGFNDNLIEKLNKTFEGKLSEEKRKGLYKYLEFIDNCFMDDNNYSLSASIAHNSLFREHIARTDILMYPSRQSNLVGLNLAINPNFVTNNMYVDRFYIIEVNNISEKRDKYNISFKNYGRVVNRVTLWKTITEEDQQFEEFVKKDFGQSFYDNIDPNKK